jgi:hypothetical protein
MGLLTIQIKQCLEETEKASQTHTSETVVETHSTEIKKTGRTLRIETPFRGGTLGGTPVVSGVREVRITRRQSHIRASSISRCSRVGAQVARWKHLGQSKLYYGVSPVPSTHRELPAVGC